VLPPPEPAYAEGYAENDPRALVDFQDVLGAYGTWRDDPAYGTVWVPSPSAVGPRFQPYVTAGRWTYDDGQWTWLSDYPWGWVPFHYGRWAWIGDAGWAWVPGRQYAGAWVDWRVGDGYVGWAPLPPQWIWRGGVAETAPYVASTPTYFFAPREAVFAPRIARRVVSGPAYVDRTVPFVQQAPPAYAPSYQRPAYVGPAPSTLGIPPARVVRPPAVDAQLARARIFARPSTAPAPPRTVGRTAPQPASVAPYAPSISPRPGPRPRPRPREEAPPAQRVR
jgi:hypothetical protein